jgi:endoglucanase
LTQGLQLVVYPNPTTGPVLLRFVSESEGDYQVRTFDLTGRLIQSFTGGARIGENIVEMNLPEVNASGVYFIEVENEGMIERKKVLVE